MGPHLEEPPSGPATRSPYQFPLRYSTTLTRASARKQSAGRHKVPLPRPVRRYPSIQTSQPLAESSPNSHKRNQLLGPLWPSLQTPDPVRAIPSKTPSYPYPRSFDVENQVMESLVSYTVTTGATTGASPWYTRYLAAHRLTYRVFSSARIASFSSSRGASSRLSTRSNYSTKQDNDNDSVSKWISVNTFAENAHLVNE